MYRSEESTENVPEPEADVGECKGMVPGIPSLDVVAQGEFGAHYVVYEDKDDGYKAC